MAKETKYQEATDDERVVEVATERLRSFKNHPFKVQTDPQMVLLKSSIEKYGILNPIIVRPMPDGAYEIISGHRRKFAAEQLGYRKVPVIIRVLEDDEAVISMVDSNLQREQILPSEKAYAYKMKYDVIKKNAGRKKSSQIDHNTGKRSISIIGSASGDSAKQVQRYIKITDLLPELLDKLDYGLLGFTPAVELSYMKAKEQKKILEGMDFAQCSPSLSQVQRMRKMSEEGTLSEDRVREVLSEVKRSDVDRVVFKNEQLYKFFPTSYTADQMRREILVILKTWMENYV